MLGERRLTTDLNGRPIGTHIDPMHRENIKRIKMAYRHPFERIPEEYFDGKQMLSALSAVDVERIDTAAWREQTLTSNTNEIKGLGMHAIKGSIV